MPAAAFTAATARAARLLVALLALALGARANAPMKSDREGAAYPQAAVATQPLAAPYVATAATIATIGLQYLFRNRLDRKSTRLNSSHITISYAVFCLKKKKT